MPPRTEAAEVLATAANLPCTRWIRGAGVLTAVFVLSMIAQRWDATTGFTSLLRFGENYTDRRIPEVADLPLAIKPNSGYDGQFYAQMAVSPTPLRKDLVHAMDNPAYRMRRILLPLVAHLVGGGEPRRVLLVFALINVVVWIAFACWLWRLTMPVDSRGLAIWLGCTLSLGVLDSVRMSLTDLTAVLMTMIAIDLAPRARGHMGVAVLAVAALVRETAAFSALALDARPWNDRINWRARARHVLIASLPVGMWALWLSRRLPGDDPLGRSNFDWPLVSIAEHAATWAQGIAAGDFDSRNVFGLLAIASFAWQSGTLLRQWKACSPWIRMALPFALLFWVLGDAVWHGYWAIARVCLPVTLAYNLTLPRDGSFWCRWLAGNICMFHGVYRLLPEV